MREKNPSAVYRAFEPLVYLPMIKDEWAEIITDSRITPEDGKSFFRKIKIIQELIKACSTPDEMSTSKKVFDPISDGIYYIYMIRNNIFHGSKKLGDIHDKNQKLRIEVYELFLKGVTSLFFLATEKNSVASDFIECPIFSNPSPIAQEIIEILDPDTIWKAIHRGIMKEGDSKLISQFNKQIVPPKNTPSEKSALFYPSAGKDMLTPLLLGLPYCTNFYFFERGRGQNREPQIIDFLRKIPTIKLDNQARHIKWEQKNDISYLDFEYDGASKRIHWVHLDNLEFLNLDVELSFYFHRGDSWGEGGSAQEWDSKFLPKLKEMIPSGKQCVFLTDGEPGGIDKNYFKSCNESNVPFLERERKYYYGYLV